VSGAKVPAAIVLGGNVAAKLRGAVRRIESLDQEISGLNADKRDVYAEMKKLGVDPNWVRSAIAFRRDPDRAAAKEEGRDQVLQILGVRPAEAAPQAALPAPGISLPAIGMADATRVRAGEDDPRQTDLEEFTGRPGAREAGR
jgi:uncharacterized protein (UPF0335 family)